MGHREVLTLTGPLPTSSGNGPEPCRDSAGLEVSSENVYVLICVIFFFAVHVCNKKIV